MASKTAKPQKKKKLLDPLSPSVLIAATESKLFGFKCEVRDGTLAEREVERRIYTFFAVLEDTHITLIDQSSGGTPRTISDLLTDILKYLSPTYREADKELSTTNILTDLFEFFKTRHLLLTKSKDGNVA